MNQKFQEYTRSCAFQISLSLRQVNSLLALSAINNVPVGRRESISLLYAQATVGTLQSLERKGLCFWDRSGERTHGPYLTSAGKLMVQLLGESGYASPEPAKRDVAA